MNTIGDALICITWVVLMWVIFGIANSKTTPQREETSTETYEERQRRLYK
jgi:hypothetical protein